MASSPMAKTKTALAFGLVGLSGLGVNQLLFWLLTENASFWISWAAIFATQGSTLWNFLLTDRLVYGGSDKQGRWYTRLAKSWTANNAFLLLRVPLLLVLAHSGMNPHLANVTTLLVLFALRFWISDRFIWGSKRLVAEVTGEPLERPSRVDVLIEMKSNEWGPHMALNLRSRSRVRRHYYDVHGLVRIMSEVPLPELGYFAVDAFGRNPDICVRRGYVGHRRMISRVQATMSPGLFVYREHLGSIGANFRVDLDNRLNVTVSPLLAMSKHVVYTNVVEALLRFVLVNKGYMLLHSATVQLGDATIMLSAQTDTGKTGTILRLLQEHPENSAFLSDDMTIVNGEGHALCFPKPLTISSHTLRAVNTRVLAVPQRMLLAVQSRVHSKDGRLFALLLARLNIPIIAINAVTQILVPPPKFMVDRLVPTARYQESGVVSRIYIIGRGEPGETLMSHEEAVTTLLANTEDAYGFPPFSIMERAITLRAKNLRKGKKRDIATLRGLERGVLEDFLGTMPVTRLISPNFGWADIIPERVLARQDRVPAAAELAVSGSVREASDTDGALPRPAIGTGTADPLSA
jgi:dolichol-phosphate mannosyltransferase